MPALKTHRLQLRPGRGWQWRRWEYRTSSLATPPCCCRSGSQPHLLPPSEGGRPLLGKAVCFSSWKAEQDGVKEAGVNFLGTHSATTYLCVCMYVCGCARVHVCVHPRKFKPSSWGPAGYAESTFKCHVGPRVEAPLVNVTYHLAFLRNRGLFKIAKGMVETSRTFSVFSEQPISAERQPADPSVFVALTFIISTVCSHNYRRRALKNGLERQSPSFIQHILCARPTAHGQSHAV